MRTKFLPIIDVKESDSESEGSESDQDSKSDRSSSDSETDESIQTTKSPRKLTNEAISNYVSHKG